MFLTNFTFPLLFLLDQLSADPASTGIRVTGHQTVTLCTVVCEEEKSRVFAPRMKTLLRLLCVAVPVPNWSSIVILFLQKIDGVLAKLHQGTSCSLCQIVETSDISCDESVACTRKKNSFEND